MIDQGLISCLRLRQQRIVNCLEPAVTVFLVRLQMGAFGPLVPRIDKQQTFIADEHPAGLIQLFLNVGLERLWTGPNKTVAAQRLSGRVVPAREHRGYRL